MINSQVGGYLGDSLAIGTVGKNQQPALRRNHRGDYRLDAKRSASLHQDRLKTVSGRQFSQLE